ncbi:MAG: OmpH family outer membrane protein [Phycisphaerales bacterium]|nr:OmpH family outer membrane protein [Phycisphaerales bacterium]
MPSADRLTRYATLVLVLLLGVAVAREALSRRPVQDAPTPTVARVVNLTTVFNQLNARAAIDAALQTRAEELQTRAEELRGQIDVLTDALELFEVGSKARTDAELNLQQKGIEYRAFAEFSNRKLEVERGERLAELYGTIRKGAAGLALDRGYQIVFVDDSLDEVTPAPERQVLEQISARRTLYTDPTVDITDELIAWINSH